MTDRETTSANGASPMHCHIAALAEYLGPNEFDGMPRVAPEWSRQLLAQHTQDLTERMGHLNEAMQVLKGMMPSDAEPEFRAIFDMTCSYAFSAANDTWTLAQFVLVTLQTSKAGRSLDGGQETH